MKFLLALFLSLTIGIASAQYPERDVRLVVPFSPGGSTDGAARIIAQGLQELWKHKLFVENRAGASGSIGTEFVVRAPADGHTLLLASGDVITSTPHIYKLAFDPIVDLIPIINLVSSPQVIVVNANSSYQTITDLINAAKNKRVLFGSAGVGTQVHLSGEKFQYVTKSFSTHVPYKGDALAIVDLLGSHIDWVSPNIVAVEGFIKEKKLRALVVSSAKRHPAIPDVPSAVEAGVKDYINVGWFGLVAPKGTPPNVIKQIFSDATTALNKRELQERYAGVGMTIMGTPGDEFKKQIERESAQWARIIKERNITIDAK